MAPIAFTCFPNLPKELRLEIWKFTLQPRIVRLDTSLWGLSFTNPPRHLHLVGGDAPYEHFSMDIPQRPTSPYYNVHLHVKDTPTPTAFFVCQESRQLALASGYKTWNVEREELRIGTRDILWHPSRDIIYLTRNEEIDEAPLSVLQDLFPKELALVQYLAIDVDQRYFNPANDQLLPHFASCSAMKEMVFVFHETYFDRRADQIRCIKHRAPSCMRSPKDYMLQKTNNSVEWQNWIMPVVKFIHATGDKGTAAAVKAGILALRDLRIDYLEV